MCLDEIICIALHLIISNAGCKTVTLVLKRHLCMYWRLWAGASSRSEVCQNYLDSPIEIQN